MDKLDEKEMKQSRPVVKNKLNKTMYQNQLKVQLVKFF